MSAAIALPGISLAQVAPTQVAPTRAEPSELAASPAAQPAANDALLALERIMADPDWIGNGPENAYWSEDSSTIYFRRERPGSAIRELWRIAREGGEPERVADAERGWVDTPDGALSPDRRYKAYSLHGDLFVKDLVTGDRRQLTKTTHGEESPRFMADSKRIAFERGEDLRIRDLETGLEEQPVDLRAEDDPATEEPADDFLARQQHRLFDIVRHEEAEEDDRRQHERALRSADPTRVAPAVFLGKDLEIVDRFLSPSGDWLLVITRAKDPEEGRPDQMPNYVTADGYVDVREVRAKVGIAPPVDHGLVLVDLAAGNHHVVDLAALPGIAVDPLADLRAAARARAVERTSGRETQPSSDEPTATHSDAVENAGDEVAPSEKKSASADESASRPVGIEIVRFSPNGRRAAIQVHSADNKDRWLALVERPGTRDAANAGDATLNPIHRLSNPQGWINWSFNQLGWLRDGRRLWFLSEETGWSQLFFHDIDTGTSQRMTNGDYVTSDVALDRDEAWLYFTANVDHPGHYDTYRVPVPAAGATRAEDREVGAVERMTRLGGLTRAMLSPDGNHLLITHSTTTRPPELFVQAAEPGAQARRLTNTVSNEFQAVDWTAPEIVAVPSSHVEQPIWSRLYRPNDQATPVTQEGGRPAVVFVHGAGYLQNSHAGWSGYFREFMFHSMLTRAGYVVLDMDYRGSRGYGRAWRTAIYRQMGHPEVEDLADGIAYLAKEQGVDPARVGVYGGSYGGFLTFMAMFRSPELFAAGAALRPVTDWAHYNHPYTSNILNTPEIDPEAYQRSSPIEYADGLAKPLLICSGMQDDNVFFQDTVRLVQRLIELEKTDFETAFYPIEAHGFVQPYSWLDEYRRIFALFERHLGQ